MSALLFYYAHKEVDANASGLNAGISQQLCRTM